MRITIDIPDEVASKVASRPQSVMAVVRLAAATALYLQGKVPLVIAARMAEVSITCFQERLAERADQHRPEPMLCEYASGQESAGVSSHPDWYWD